MGGTLYHQKYKDHPWERQNLRVDTKSQSLDLP